MSGRETAVNWDVSITQDDHNAVMQLFAEHGMDGWEERRSAGYYQKNSQARERGNSKA